MEVEPVKEISLGALRGPPNLSLCAVMKVMCGTKNGLHCRQGLWLQPTQAFCVAKLGIKRLVHSVATWATWLPRRLTWSVPPLLLESETPAEKLDGTCCIHTSCWPCGGAHWGSCCLPALPEHQCCLTACLLAAAGRRGQQGHQINRHFSGLSLLFNLCLIVLSLASELEQLYVSKATLFPVQKRKKGEFLNWLIYPGKQIQTQNASLLITVL